MTGPAGVDPWKALERAVARRRPKPGQLYVADSKKVKSGPRGFQRLEQTVLTFWAAWRGSLPYDLGELLESIGFDVTVLDGCPWYEELDVRLPRWNDAREIELGGHLLRRELDAAGIELLKIAVRPVEVVEFNRMIAETDNKSTTHFRAYAEVLADVLREAPDGSHVVADRCGGRMRYRQPLLDTGAARAVRIESETPSASTYRLTTDRGVVTVSFASRGEERAFPTALASCAAKFVRELFVERLNEWFCAAVPDLAPTAGYYVDGHRFLEEIRAFAEAERLPIDRLVRSR